MIRVKSEWRAARKSPPEQLVSSDILTFLHLFVPNGIKRQNAQIVEDALSALKPERSPILLTERTTHADWFAKALQRQSEERRGFERWPGSEG